MREKHALQNLQKPVRYCGKATVSSAFRTAPQWMKEVSKDRQFLDVVDR